MKRTGTSSWRRPWRSLRAGCARPARTGRSIPTAGTSSPRSATSSPGRSGRRSPASRPPSGPPSSTSSGRSATPIRTPRRTSSKIEYYRRIEEANHLFTRRPRSPAGSRTGAGSISCSARPNRGPTPAASPSTASRRRSGITAFPIVFIDDDWNGIYRLDPDSAEQIGNHEDPAGVEAPGGGCARGPGQPGMRLKDRNPGRGQCRLKSSPYKAIWFKAGPGAGAMALRTTLTADVVALDGAGVKVWEHQGELPAQLAPRRSWEKVLDQTIR